MKKTTLKKLQVNFIAGIAALLPIFGTVYIIRFLILLTNSAILNPVSSLLEVFWKGAPSWLAKIIVLVVVLLFILLVGAGTRLLILKRVIVSGERLLSGLPFISRIYKAIKQMSTAFLGEGRGIFIRVVLVQYPRPGLYSIGFVTNEANKNIDAKTGKVTLSIFVPTTPNPTSGMLIIAPKEELIFLDMSVEDAMKLVISGGAVAP